MSSMVQDAYDMGLTTSLGGMPRSYGRSSYSSRNSYKKSNNSKGGHTYDKWQELGYQVKKGEKYAYKMYGQYIFTRDQVV